MKHLLVIPSITMSLVIMIVLSGCQATGQMKDEPRSEDAALQSEGLQDSDRFSVEKIIVGEQKILGVEHLKPHERFGQKGWNVYYEFHMLNENGKATGTFVSFGSYDSTNEVSRSFGSLPIGHRLYHLDLYEVNRDSGRMTSHATIRFYKSKTRPPYDAIRDEAVKFLERAENQIK
jgi:hypothetical protein